MIARSWSARVRRDDAPHYVAHARTAVFAHLSKIKGYRGALVLTEERAADVAVTVLTFWESMDAVEAFAGPDRGAAVVEPDAEAALIDFDHRVRHFEVAASQAVWPGLLQP
jgi:heme-degrading monooxygenase HmoA